MNWKFASIAALAAAGDRSAFERLYRRHVDRVYSVCARMVADRARAEELTQDVFVRAWEKLRLFRGESAFSTWLHRLAINVVLNDRKTGEFLNLLHELRVLLRMKSLSEFYHELIDRTRYVEELRTENTEESL